MTWNSGKGSWYSWYKGHYRWEDKGDRPNSNALQVPDDCQGISFFNHKTLGDWFLVKFPNGNVSIEQQTDLGPNPRTGRKIDISAACADRMGYSPHNFPTDATFYWEPCDPPKEVAKLIPRKQAIKYKELRK